MYAEERSRLHDSSKAGQRGARSEMVESLVKSKAIARLPRTKVLEILGEPYDQSEETGLKGDLFFVGADRQIGIDNEWIHVSYDENELVSDVKLVVQ